jgi:FHS family L-fucose permease-like MFS transporter
VLLISIVYIRTPLPEIVEETPAQQTGNKGVKVQKPLFKHRHFVLGVIAQFAYVAAQTGIFSFFVNYMTDAKLTPHFDKETAAFMLGLGGFGLFMVGRVSGTFIMKFINPTRLLAIYSLMSVLLLPVISLRLGMVSIVALFLSFFFMSIMYPTIFSLGIKDMGEQTKRASSFIVMAIVGGAIFPIFMGWIADISSMAIGFFAPIPCFIFILYYALKGHKVRA